MFFFVFFFIIENMKKPKATRCKITGCQRLGTKRKEGTWHYPRGYCRLHYKTEITEKGLAKKIGPKDGRKSHPLYETHRGMRRRCYQPAHKFYANYGGRGIKVCDRWRIMPEGFINFVEDMGERPEGYTLDRIDNDKGYSPENCAWASKKSQSNNRRVTRTVTYKGETHTISEWAEKTGIRYRKLYRQIVGDEWPLERVFKNYG